MEYHKQFPTSVGILFREISMDQRVARGEQSKAAIKDAFIKLFRKKEPEEISVIDVCKKAGVNRSTFYAHFSNMNQLIRDVIRDNVALVCRGYDTQWNLPLEDGGVERSQVENYLTLFLANPTLQRFCTCSNNSRYRELIIRAQVEFSLGSENSPEMYYRAYFQNAGVFNCVLEWIANGRPIPRDEIVEIIHDYSKAMYRSVSR